MRKWKCRTGNFWGRQTLSIIDLVITLGIKDKIMPSDHSTTGDRDFLMGLDNVQLAKFKFKKKKTETLNTHK